MQQGNNIHSLSISPELIQLKRKLIQPSILNNPQASLNYIDTQTLKIRNHSNHLQQFNQGQRSQQRRQLMDNKDLSFSQQKLKDSKYKSYNQRQRHILPPMNIPSHLKYQSPLKHSDDGQMNRSYVKRRFTTNPNDSIERDDSLIKNRINEPQLVDLINKAKFSSKVRHKVYYRPQQIRTKLSHHAQFNSFQQPKRHIHSSIKLGIQAPLPKRRIKTLLGSYQDQCNLFQLQTQFNKFHYVTFESVYTKTFQQNSSLLNKVPSVPKQIGLKKFLKSYEPHCEDISIKQLLKSNFCSFQLNNNQVYVGQMIGKARSGLGILFKQDFCLEGHWKKNQIVKGVQVNKLGIYNGSFQNNLKNGQGQFQWYNGDSYVGQWLRGLQNGKGLWINSRGQSYNGEWRNGKAQGVGILAIKNTNNIKLSRKYKGAFVNNKQHGFGRQHFANGDNYEGMHKNGKPQGKGTYSWANGSVYQGDFQQGLRQGMGILKNPFNLCYKGQFRNDCAQGQCELLMPNGDKYYGMLKNGKKNGKGTLHIESTSQIFNGYWRNDYFINSQDQHGFIHRQDQS